MDITCKDNEFGDCKEDKSFKLKFHSESKIIIIDSFNDLNMLPRSENKLRLSESLDFELLSTIADAIWLTDKGQSATRHSMPISLYGWDCESILIMNKNCVY